MSYRFRLLAIGAVLAASHAVATEPPARDRAKALLGELDKGGASQGAARDATAEARRALTRADKARLAGDQTHGALLESLALEWAEAARDLARTAQAESRASEAEKKLTAADAKLRTTRTLIEQAAARRARADAELAALEKGPAPAASSTPASSSTPAPSSAPSAPPSPKPKGSSSPPAPKPSSTPPAPKPPNTPPAPKPKEPK